MTRRRRARIDGNIQDAIDELALKGWTPSQIHRELGERFTADRLPDVRTVQRRVKDLTPRDPSGPWSLADADTDEAALVMPLWREVVEYTEGKISHLTKDEARWIVRIRRVAPKLYPHGLSFWQIYLLAREYVLLTERRKPTTAPDSYLAFAPWESLEAALRYQDALRKGLIPARLIPDPTTEEADATEEGVNLGGQST